MKTLQLLVLFFAILSGIYAQQDIIPVADNLVTKNIPALPASDITEINNYTESRSASFASWHPLRKEMLISTRFANTNQLHYVKMPSGARKQITFFDEPVYTAKFDPLKGEYILFLKDNGGDEFMQIYRLDLATRSVNLLTDGQRSQNGNITWNHKGDQIAYTSTRRNGKDRDIYILDPLDPSSDKLIVENSGGGWGIVDWSADNSRLLLQEQISINESRLYIADLISGIKTRILPEKNERTTFNGIGFSNDGKGIYLTTTRDNEFQRLAFFHFASKKLKFLTSTIPWNVDGGTLSKDGKQLAFVTNENGLSGLYILQTSLNKYQAVPELPPGVIQSIEWTKDSRSLAFTFTSYDSSSDVYEYNTDTRKIIRWTESEPGPMDLSALQPPRLISWTTFDGKTISGYLYKASSRFVGKRPVIINIHGGPEGQFRPTFLGRSYYYTNELGISIIYPNVRGSTGYGKTFTDLDNGMNRMESVKDIGSLLDWIATQPELDADRIMITGGSYGGFMTLAVSYMYSDKIRCSVDLVGISNFNTFLRNTEAYRRDHRRAEYGDEREPEMTAFFDRTAPLNNTDKIKKPLFIIQGGNDPRVPASESIQMKEKIIENGGIVWFLMAKDEGHGFRKKGNQDFQFYSTIEFIKQFLLN